MDPQAFGTDHRLWLLATAPLSLLGWCGLAIAIWKLLPAVGGVFLRITGAILTAGLAIGMAILSALIWLGEFPGGGRPAGADTHQGEPRK